MLKAYERRLGGLEVVPSDGGRFEVTVDGRPVFSKLGLGRHAEPGEVARLLGEALAEGSGGG